MKNFEDFKEDFVADVREQLAEQGHDDLSFQFGEIRKMNSEYEALTIMKEDSNIGMNFNISKAFAAYEDGADYGELVNQASDAITKGIAEMPVVDVNQLMNYEVMKEKLSIEVVSAETNADLLKNVPHENIEDMAAVYRFVLSSDSDGRSSILVTNEMLDKMGVTREQLKADALANAPEIRPVVIQGMNEVMMEMMGPDAFEAMGMPELPEEAMYVASVPDKTSGAGVLAYQDFMDQAADRIGGDFFVLPSSIHEILLVPDDGLKTADELRAMVQEVNATQVSPEDKLTDSVYHYDSKDHVFELAEKFEARQLEKEAGLDEKSEEGHSVLKELKDKQKEAAAKPHVKDTVEKAAKAKGDVAL